MSDFLTTISDTLDREPDHHHDDAPRARQAGALSATQREILAALAKGWSVHRWRCTDGIHRWHAGEDAIDGRSVRGLRQRGLVEIDMQRHRLPSLVLARGRGAGGMGR